MALIASASMHAAVALAAARGPVHAALNANLPTDQADEIAPVELSLAELPVETLPLAESAPAPGLAHHHHDYPVPASHDAKPHDPALRHVLPLAAPSNSLSAAGPVATIAPGDASPPAVVESPAPMLPRFAMTVGLSAHARLAVATSGNEGNHATNSGSPTTAVAEGSVDTPAKLLTGGVPSYTQEAEAAGIEADVPLEIVVDPDGAVVSARALSRVGYGLEEAAVRSVRGYRFSPARRAGKPLAVRMRWLMRFELR